MLITSGGNNLKLEKGVSIVEIIIVVAIISIGLIGLFGVVSLSLNISSSVKITSMANNLAKDTVEAVKSFKDGTNWDVDGLGTLNTGSANTYYPEIDTVPDPDKWLLTSGTETIGIFSREVFFEPVSRDPFSQDIENSYNSLNDDPNTRKAIITVSWKDKEVKIITYFTNWR